MMPATESLAFEWVCRLGGYLSATVSGKKRVRYAVAVTGCAASMSSGEDDNCSGASSCSN